MRELWSPESGSYGRNDLERDIGGLIDEAINHVEHTLTPSRRQATDYYFGRPFGNEEEGRSQVVDTTVRDTVQGMLPSLLRIFLGSERTVEFRPRGAEDEAVARQQTDYINYVIREDNDGFLQFTSAFLDAMVRKLGVFKYWWEKKHREAGHQYEGLTEQDLIALQMDPTVAKVEVTAAYTLAGMPEGQVLYDADVTQSYDESVARFEALPPEEFLFTPSARCKDDATLLGHRREMRKSALLAMGFTEKALESIGAFDTSISQNEEAQARLPDATMLPDGETEDFDPTYLYVEAYVNRGGSWRKYVTLGSGYFIQNGGGKGEPVAEAPFALLPCILEPHTIIGQSIADLTMDLQRLNSAVWRGTVDSLGNAILPRTAVDEYNVHMQDVQNIEVGGVIRTKGPPSNAIMEFKHSFVGSDTLPFLQYLNEVRENRTGQTKAAAGLDADALQSSTKAAVAATLSASQQRIEMLARTFAETGIKQLFKGLLRLVVEHQDRARVVRLRNQYVPVDPRTWDATMDVTVHVGLGTGMPEDKLNMLSAIAQKQEQIMQSLGPVNPLVTLSQYRNTLTRMVEIAGFANPDEFFLPIDPQVLQQMTQAAAQQQKPDPAQVLAEAEMKIKQAELQVRQQELALKQAQIARDQEIKLYEIDTDDARERDQQAGDLGVKEADILLKRRELALQEEELNLKERDLALRRQASNNV